MRMVMRGMMLICFLFGHDLLWSQPFHVQNGNAYISSGAYSLHFTDAFSFSSNPASLGSVKYFLAGALTERKWMLRELDNHWLSFSVPAGGGGVGLALQQSGDADFSEGRIGLAYGKKLSGIELGIRFDYLWDRAAGYGSLGFGSAGIGILFHISGRTNVGWGIDLPLTGKAGKSNEETGAQVFYMGLGYEPGPDLYLCFQIEKSSGQPVNCISSLEYRYGEQFSFSLGFGTAVSSVYFKTGWKKNRLGIQIYTRIEPMLGFTPGLLLSWETKTRKG